MKKITPKHDPEDFSDVDGLTMIPGDPEVPKSMLHGTPAIVWRLLDNRHYNVIGLHYDGDTKGFVVTINAPEGAIELSPGSYRTHAMFMWDKDSDKLNIFILD